MSGWSRPPDIGACPVHEEPAEQGLSSPRDGKSAGRPGYRGSVTLKHRPGARPRPRTTKGLVSGLSDGTGVRGCPGLSVPPAPSTRTPKTRYIRPLFTRDVTGFEHPPAPLADTASCTNPSTTSAVFPCSVEPNPPGIRGTEQGAFPDENDRKHPHSRHPMTPTLDAPRGRTTRPEDQARTVQSTSTAPQACVSARASVPRSHSASSGPPGASAGFPEHRTTTTQRHFGNTNPHPTRQVPRRAES